MKRRLPVDVQRTLRDFSAWAKKRFRRRLVQLELFGSFSRGEGDRWESDVDVLIVIERMTQRELERIVWRAAEIGVEHNVQLSAIAFGAARWRQMQRDEMMLTREVARDGVPL